MGNILHRKKRSADIASALLKAAIMAVAFAINSWLVINISQQHGGMAAIWSANAILLFAVLDRPLRNALPFYMGAFAASLLANRLAGFDWANTASFSLANMFEIAFAAGALQHERMSGEDRFDPRNIVRLAATAIIACSLSATIAITGLREGWANAWLSWFMSDTLGILLLLPILLVVREAFSAALIERWPVDKIAEQLSICAFLCATTLAVFSQSDLPVTFLIAIPVLLAVFKAGRSGAVLSTLIVAAIATSATMMGYGPFTGPTMDVVTGMLLLQAFLACQLLIALPVASVLEQRTRDADNALERERNLRNAANDARRKAENANRKLVLSMARDELTGLRSRRRILQKLQNMLERTAEKQVAAAIAIFDVDHFKQVNDRFGHEAGDNALRAIGRICRDVLPRRFDVGRIGGEEFLLLMPGETIETAARYAEQLRLAVMQQSSRDAACSVTISLGLAEAQAGDTSTKVMRAADLALYAAKSSGRNQLKRAA
jgi:diguanylate cyclase